MLSVTQDPALDIRFRASAAFEVLAGLEAGAACLEGARQSVRLLPSAYAACGCPIYGLPRTFCRQRAACANLLKRARFITRLSHGRNDASTYGHPRCQEGTVGLLCGSGDEYAGTNLQFALLTGDICDYRDIGRNGNALFSVLVLDREYLAVV